MQIFEELPDIGTIEYIGSKSKNSSVDYSLEGVRGKDCNKNFNKDEADKNFNKNVKNQSMGKIDFCESYGEDVIRLYANIEDIKSIVNTGLYCDIIQNIAQNKCGKYNDIIIVEGKVQIYGEYQDKEDIFVKIENYCIWLKKNFLDTDIKIIASVTQDVKVIGYVLKEKNQASPCILKAIAIYI